MALVLDATVASASANSYLTVAAADALAAATLGRDASVWTAASEDDKVRALVTATADVDGHVGAVDVRHTDGQALLFPRAVDVSAGSPFIHATVRRATFHQAAFLLSNADSIADADARRAQGLLSRSDMDGGWTLAMRGPSLMSSIAEQLLRPLRFGRRATVGTVAMTSSYRRDPYDPLDDDADLV